MDSVRRASLQDKRSSLEGDEEDIRVHFSFKSRLGGERLPRLLPLPQPWTLLSCPLYQGKAQDLAITPRLSQGHVVVVPYVVCAIITSMYQLRKPRLGLYQPVEKSGSDLSILDLEPLPHETPLQ